MNIRVFIVDDHALIREGIKNILELEPACSVVGEAPDGRDILSRLAQCQCDVLILDISLPDKGGLEVLKDVKINRSKTRVLVLSMYPEEHFAIRALKDGADGYLVKHRVADELVPALKTVMAGEKYISPAVAREMDARPATPRERHPRRAGRKTRRNGFSLS